MIRMKELSKPLVSQFAAAAVSTPPPSASGAWCGNPGSHAVIRNHFGDDGPGANHTFAPDVPSRQRRCRSACLRRCERA